MAIVIAVEGGQVQGIGVGVTLGRTTQTEPDFFRLCLSDDCSANSKSTVILRCKLHFGSIILVRLRLCILLGLSSPPERVFHCRTPTMPPNAHVPYLLDHLWMLLHDMQKAVTLLVQRCRPLLGAP